ncbi:glycosyltransferase [Lacticaseibacillus sp. N501-2]|uniref:glycosyltransferase n=1 Tax=Lacticaseibacillus salsurae TaxID=3367729 RepID=UPI0038B3CCD2
MMVNLPGRCQERCCCVVLNYNDYETTATFVKNMEDSGVLDCVLIVDNCSTDDSLAQLKKICSSDVYLVSTPKNGGYGAGNNFGIRYAYNELKCDLVLLSNPDITITEDTISKMKQAILEDSSAAVVSATQLNKDGAKIADTSWNIPSPIEYAFSDTLISRLCWHGVSQDNADFCDKLEVECVPGALIMLRCCMFLSVGGYDERMFLYGEETTLGIKLKSKGYTTLLLTNETYIHQQSTSINKSIQSTLRKLKILQQSRLIVLTSYMAASHPVVLCAQVVFAYQRMRARFKRMLTKV